MFNIGDTVRIVKEPVFILYKPSTAGTGNMLGAAFGGDDFVPEPCPEGEGSKSPKADLQHLVGIECKVIGYTPNIFASGPFGSKKKVENSKSAGIGFYHLDIPLTAQEVPKGLLWEGISGEYLELVNKD